MPNRVILEVPQEQIATDEIICSKHMQESS